MKEKTPKEFFKFNKIKKFRRNFNNNFTFLILNFKFPQRGVERGFKYDY